MNSLHQQILYSFIGTIKLSSDKLKELMEDLIQNQQYTEDEGKRITMEFTHQMDAFKKDLQLRISMHFEDAKSRIQTPIQNKSEEFLKDIKQKIQDYSIQQILSK